MRGETRRNGKRGTRAAILSLAALAAQVAGCTSSSEPAPRDEPPAAVLFVAAGPGADTDTLRFRQSTESDFAAYRIERTRAGTLDPTIDPRVAEFAREPLARLATRADTSWIDTSVSPGHLYRYWLRVEDDSGQESRADSLDVRMVAPGEITLGLEPRSLTVGAGEAFPLSLWIGGVNELHGLVLQIEHRVSRAACLPSSVFGDPTLTLCLGAEEGPTDLALSGVRGGPSLSGAARLATFAFSVASPGADSVSLGSVRLLRADGTPVPGWDRARLLSSRIEAIP